MKSFETTFNKWINNKIGSQIKIINKISIETDVDAEIWFNQNFLSRNVSDYSGTEFLDEMLEDYLCYIGQEFNKKVGKYLKSTGTNIYNKPIFDLYITLEYNFKNNYIFINEKYGCREDIENIIKSISLNDRNDLMKDKLFSYVVNKTKLNIFSDKDIRALKLKQLNEI